MTTTTYTIYRNDVTNYQVTLIDTGRGARVIDSKGYDFPMVGADYPHAALLAASRAHLNGAVEVPAVAAPAPVVSPLAPAAQVPASNLGRGARLTVMSEPLARAVVGARVARGGGHAIGTRLGRNAVTTLPMLQALVRRGHAEWVERFRTVEITQAGHVAADAWLDGEWAKITNGASR